MAIAQLLTPDRVIHGLRATDKSQLLQELARRAGDYVKIPQKAILEALVTREKLGSTGLGNGFALPHARIDGLAAMFGMFAKLTRPIAYEAIDENSVDLVFLLLIPTDAGSDHVAALAAISRRIRDHQCAERLRKAENAAALYALLTNGDGQPH
jgi:PTS system nitrogen regulatory IIA component